MSNENPQSGNPLAKGPAATPAATPAVQTAPATPVATVDASTLQALLALVQLTMAREARLSAKEEAEELSRQAKNAQREKNSANHTEKDLLRQARCTHLKGGKKGPRSGVRDFAIYLHTYINAESVIKCFICKMGWKVKDTAEFLVRRGKKIANHTKIGWQEAQIMLQQTTNQPSSAEIPLQATPQAALAGGEND